MTNYGAFLFDVRKNYVESEKLFLKALSIDDKFPDAVLNYACFLREVKRDHEGAELFISKLVDLGDGIWQIFYILSFFLQGIAKARYVKILAKKGNIQAGSILCESSKYIKIY